MDEWMDETVVIPPPLRVEVARYKAPPVRSSKGVAKGIIGLHSDESAHLLSCDRRSVNMLAFI